MGGLGGLSGDRQHGRTDGTTEAAVQRELEEARFAVAIADALAGTLNLHRTLARTAHLAVPALGRAAAVVLWDGQVLHVAGLGPGGEETANRLDARQARPGDLGRLEAALETPLHEVEVTGLDDLAGLGLDPGLAARLLAGSPGRVTLAPLRSHGSALGVLLVVGDRHEPARQAHVEALARRAAVAIAAAKVYDERATLAETLRSSLLPAPLPATPGIRLGAAYRPAEQVAQIGGDFYDVLRDGEGWCFSLGDVCGKGVEAAVLTGQVRQSLRTVLPVASDPGERLRLVNAALFQTDGRSYVTVLHAALRRDAEGVAVRLACGGHPPPLLRRSDGRVTPVTVGGTLIGMLPVVRFDETDLLLRPGDTLLCYTDGLSEASGPEGRFGEGRIAELLADSAGMTAQAITERLVQRCLDHATGTQRDDIAVLAVQAEEAAR